GGATMLYEPAYRASRRLQPASGFVSIAVERDAASARFAVANSGPSVPPDVVPRLFEPFFRTDESRSRDSGGAGLGLSIVAAVASAHGGDATASARPDAGLVVTVIFASVPATVADNPSDERRRPLSSALPPPAQPLRRMSRGWPSVFLSRSSIR